MSKSSIPGEMGVGVVSFSGATLIETPVTTDLDRVRDAIENIKELPGTAGIFNFSPEDHNGLDINSFEMLTVKDGKFAIYQK